MDPSNLTLRAVNEAAETFLNKFHPSLALPIPIEKITELQLGIAIQVIPGLKDLLAIDAYINHEFSHISIDENVFTQFPQRARFSIAHEIGHYIMHHEWYSHYGPKTIQDFVIFQEKISNQTYDYMERQANTFAGLILVPRGQLISEIKKRIGSLNQARAYSSPIVELTETFDVSEQVILIRMQKEHIIEEFKGMY